ncbi:peptide/nickel transport system substrate-binding protein [Rhizobium sp. BK313]|uniref:ABC transporter substrate-binding protein n=1 Tax=Rhizobium sp. BK313 TaxID=2587081 RepID=UPI00105F3A29|nr:ABC transporter substrate-binding protein [Rhizobium sp. BK313]MBB3459015.1 peptide/nickel transport system substrate-binding protein [Rhizobium sp. BK313]
MSKLRFIASTAVAALLAGVAGTASASAKTVVTMNTVQIFGTIDPAKISDYTDYMAAVNLYDGLITVDSKGNLLPELAESWTISPDAKEVTFKLRADAHFTDGTPVQAADVVYSFERLLKINQGPANLFADVLKPGSIITVDPKTVKFTLSKAFAPFLSTVPAVFIVNSNVVKANAGSDDGQTYLATHSAGAGPYTLKEWDRGASMTVDRDPNYYKGFGDGPIDEVHWIITNDEATVRSLAASGELTMSSQYQAPDTYKALKEMGRFNIVSQDTTIGFYLKLNTKVPPTDDIHIRKALAYATDYDTIRNVIVPGGQLNGPLPAGFADFYANDLQPPKFDMDAAKAEIAKSKYAGSEIPITLGYVAGTKFEEELSLLMQSNLEQLGFKVTQEADPWNRVTELASKVETTPAVNQIFFGPTYPSPDSMFFTQYHSKAAGTWASAEWLQDPAIDALIDQARTTTDPKQQADIYKDLQHKIVDLQPDVFLQTQTVQHAMDKCLEGFNAVPMQSFDYKFTRYHWVCK